MANKTIQPSLIQLQSQVYKKKKLPGRCDLYGIWGFDRGFGRYLFCVGGHSAPGMIIRLRQESEDWEVTIAESPFGMRGVWGSSLSQVFAIGDSGAIFFSSDGGDTWAQRRSPQADHCFYRMTGDGGERIWICMDRGKLLSSEDLGLHWQEQVLSRKRLLSIHRTENGLLFVGTAGGEIFSSANHGKTWNPTNTGTKHSINHIWSDSKTLYASCNEGDFLSSLDGAQWKLSRPVGEIDVESGSATLDGNVYLLGSSGAVFLRRPGEEWQELARDGLKPWWAAHSFEDRSTFLCGDSGRLALHLPGEELRPLILQSS
jgi:photosystem II stability/assembly factor-like uncharacterized protein